MWGRAGPLPPEANGASRGGSGADHAAGISALAMSGNSVLRARWTSWTASTLATACAAASSGSLSNAKPEVGGL